MADSKGKLKIVHVEEERDITAAIGADQFTDLYFGKDEFFIIPDHNINVKDDIEAKDNLSTWKRWFNGAKHFFTVKPSPPKK